MTGIDLSKKYNISCPEQINPADPVLVVDDQQDLRLIVVHHLGKLQFKKVLQAANGLEAMEVVRTHKLSAIICDLDMPNMNGLDFLGELREDVNCHRVPFCLTMNNVSRDKIMLSIEHGVDEILVKPFTLGDILPKIKSAFKVFHNPKNPEKLYELAKGLMRDKKYNESKEVYEALHIASPKAARPVVGLARIAKLQGDEKKCLELLAEAEKSNPNYVHIYTIRGDLYAAKKDWETALKNYNQGIDLSPLNPMRYISAVKVLMELKKYEESAKLLEKAIAANVNFPELFNYLSQAYFQLKDFKMAIKAIQKALASQPDNLHFLNQLGIAFKESQQPKEAMHAYNRIIKLEPGNIPALFNKAILLGEMEQIPEAIKALERILLKDPEQPNALAKMNEFRELEKKKKDHAPDGAA